MNAQVKAIAPQTEVKKIAFLEVKDNETNDGLYFVLTSKKDQTKTKKLEFKWADATEELRQYAMRHGFNQKIRDASAGFSGNEKKNIPEDFEGAYAAMDEVIKTLKAGSWNKISDNGIGAIKQKLAKALNRFDKKLAPTIERAEAVIASVEESVWREWWANVSIQKAWAEIELEEKTAKTAVADSTSLVASLNAAFAKK